MMQCAVPFDRRHFKPGESTRGALRQRPPYPHPPFPHTAPQFEPIDRKSQRGSHTAGTQLVQTASIGTQFHPAKAWSQVDIGDGANAISIANEATASAYSSQDHDGLDPTRPQPLMRRPLKEDGSFQTALPQPVKLD